ncbi:MAG: TIM barrel protein [Planctomycetes bacterium]|nr:TIM barrel protein [Planctomycetota bacterium]
MNNQNKNASASINRRQLLRTAAGATAAGALAMAVNKGAAEEKAVTKGRIKQSIVEWCFADYWDMDEMCKVAVKLGCKSIELVGPEHWPTLKKYGLECAIAPSHLFVQGMNNPRYQSPCIEMLKKTIDDCADAGFKTVITFTGFSQESGEWADGGIPDLEKLPKDRPAIEPEVGIKNCVAGIKKVVGYAERKKVNLSLEILNTRVTDHPMKGHPGYQGNHVDYCMEIINGVGSPRFGLLFDIYHVQIMDGDIIRRIRQCGDAINHVHTAGNPGRNELDPDQEINFPACMKALLDIGYKGFVGQEFIPTRDPLKGLTEAVKLCDV